MTDQPNPQLTVVADDLSGAQECIAVATRLGPEVRRGAGPSAATMLGYDASLPKVQVLSIDIDSRMVLPEEAAARCGAALMGLRNNGRTGQDLFFKFDSLVRGPITAQIRAATKVVGPVVFCPAVPALQRYLRNGVVHIGEVPLNQTDLWHLEPDAAPESVFDLFAELYTSKVNLAEVRSGGLPAKLQDASPDTQVFICDAENDEDLDAIAAAARAEGLALAGASGLCSALARVGSVTAGAQPPVFNIEEAGTLFVMGTASQQAQPQVRKLTELGIPVVDWIPGDPVTLPHGDCIITVAGPVRPGEAADIDAGLARLITEQSRGRDLFLTGGQTARSVLDALDIRLLTPLAQPEFGTVLSCTVDGRLVATRPGSFGSPDNLARSLDSFRSFRSPSERTFP